MKLAPLILALFFAGCADVKSHSVSSLSDGSEIHSFKCDDNWDGCYRAAARACGERGYVEIDRAADSGSTSTERMERVLQADDGINTRELPGNLPRDPRRDGVLTIRCNPHR
jgi:hypothetical protein